MEEEIKQWIINCYSYSKLSFDSCLIISGSSGSGKSYLINKIVKDLDLFHISINSNIGISFDQQFGPVTKQKDLMINHARMYAQQEYDRIIELVSVLEKQAQAIKRRLEITDAVHAAVYQFQPVMGNVYWLVWDQRKQHTLLTQNGPNDWSSSAPEDYQSVCCC
jgi:adenylate kinase family enzyme